MAYQLVVETLYHAPGAISGTARLVLISIAEKVREGRTVDMSADDLATCCGVDAKNVRAAMRRLADVGLDPRVPLGQDKNGQPVYAVPGRLPTYRLPSFTAPAGCRCDLCAPAVRARSGSAGGERWTEASTLGGPSRPPSEETAGQARWTQPSTSGGPKRPPSEEIAAQVGGRFRPPPNVGGRKPTADPPVASTHPSVVQSQNQIDQTDGDLEKAPASVKVIHQSLTDAGLDPTVAEAHAVLAAVSAVAVKSTGRAPGPRYVDKIANATGFGAFLDEIRVATHQQAAADVEVELQHLANTHPDCAHGTQGGTAIHPRTGQPICPQCRRGIPATTEPEPPPTPADEVMRRYRHAWLTAGHSPAVPGRLVMTLASEARRFTEAGHTPDDLEPVITAAAQAGSSMSAVIAAAGRPT